MILKDIHIPRDLIVYAVLILKCLYPENNLCSDVIGK